MTIRPLTAGLATVALAVQLCASAFAAEPKLTVLDAWIRPAPPGAPLAAYMTLDNRSASARSLVAASSREVGRITIHRTVRSDAVVTMKQAAGVEIAAHGRLAFAPGGHHLMLERPAHALQAGDSVRIVLRFADGSAIPAVFHVREPAASAAADPGHAAHLAGRHQTHP